MHTTIPLLFPILQYSKFDTSCKLHIPFGYFKFDLIPNIAFSNEDMQDMPILFGF